MREAEYIEVKKMISIIETSIRKKEISRTAGENIIEDIYKNLETNKYKTVDYKYGKETKAYK